METMFKLLEKFSTRPLFFIFLGLSSCELFQKDSVLKNPTIENIITLLGAMVLMVFLTWGVEQIIFRFNLSLQSNDQGDIGPMIGTAALAIYIVYSFHFLSGSPDALNLKLLTQPGFIYSTTLLLFSFEIMKQRRFKQK